MTATGNSKFEELRWRAEDLLRDRKNGKAEPNEIDIMSLIHELEVHQIELQLQNEELLSTRNQLEESRKAYADLYEQAPVGYITVNEKGMIVGANFTASEMLRILKSDLIDRGFSSFIHPEDQQTYFALIREIAGKPNAKNSGEVRLLKAKVVPFHARLEIVPFWDSKSAFSGWRIVFTDISELKRTEEELKGYAERLKRSNQELQDFAFIASHDLQEPLRKIHAFGDQLKKKYGQSLGPEGADYVDRMSAATGRLQGMIRALLDYSRVVSKGEKFSEVSLGKIVEGVISDLDFQIKRLKAEIKVEELPVVRADPNQMRQLFQNLISNALKFHSEGGVEVKIYSKPEKETVTLNIFVRDNGIGFNQKDAERIFNLFERLHGRSAYEGSGMGLALCRKIVERHGGTIKAESEPGHGSTFIITFPAAQ